MAFEGEQRIVAKHAAAIVDDANQSPAARLDFHANNGGAGVERILEEFFDDGSGAFDYFSGGDFVGDLVGKNANPAQGSMVTVRRFQRRGAEKE